MEADAGGIMMEVMLVGDVDVDVVDVVEVKVVVDVDVDVDAEVVVWKLMPVAGGAIKA